MAVTATLLTALALATSWPARAADEPMPRPAALERDVQFWIRVYTEVDTNGGFLHDLYNLGVVYETLHFPPDTTPQERQRIVDAARTRYAEALERIAAAGDAPLTAEDQRIRELWGAEATPAQLHAAADDVRFQLGQADRFRAGLIRSGAWETHIAETLANLGLPAELAVLPHVESSFNPNAYSKVGAAGLWQFMRSTGRRYLRIDGAVDDRLDPFRSTEAAAQLLAYNYRVLGTWPLALTAYNHGTAGVRHARDALGTDDIVRIVRSYTSRTFGFASRNFYVSFLAALAIDRDPAKYFGSLRKDPEAHFQEVELPAYVPAAALAQALGVDFATLRALNPALLPPVWSGQLRIPKAYRLRLPAGGEVWTSARLAQRLAPGQLYTAQRGPHRYKVQSGDTLANLADRYGLPIDRLARVNHLRTSARLKPGSVITLPEPTTPVAGAPAAVVTAAPAAAPGASARAAVSAVAATAVAPPTPGGAVSGEAAELESATDAAVAAARAGAIAHAHGAGASQPVSAAQSEALGPALGAPGDTEQNADPFDYAVAADGTILVAPEETLGHYADWLGVTSEQLRALNSLGARASLRLGQRVQLDFTRVTPQNFETLRRAWHRGLQAKFFAGHRIVGTEIRITRAGDSVWTLTQHGTEVPIWLLQQYNPDLDLGALRAGTHVVVPRIEEVGNGG